MTAQDLHTRLGRMIEEGHIHPDDKVVWSGMVGSKAVTVAVTGLDAASREFKFHNLSAYFGALQFGRVTP